MLRTSIGIALFGLLFSSLGLAHPVSFRGSTSLNSFNAPDSQEFLLSYSYQYWGSVGAKIQREATPTGDLEFYLAQTTLLLKRWNNPESQGNIYLGIGAGQERRLDNNFSAQLADIQADWESRKIYTMAGYTQIFRQDTDDLRMNKQRIGYAPYLGEFGELNIWAILERTQKNDETHSLNQFLRFYYKNILWELGVSSKGETLFNFMVHN